MKDQLPRRVFLKTGALACCTLFLDANVSAVNCISAAGNTVPDPSKMNYCGHKCPEDCKFLEASVKNDPVLKKEAYEIWEMKERFGVEKFEADKIFCFGCKNKEKPAGIRLQKCDVRVCAISKNYEACIECDSLSTCDKDLWKKFPEFHQSVIKLQLAYLEANK